MSKEALKATIRDTEDDSAYEKCGFVVHVFVILFGCGYLYCVTSSSSEPPFDTRWTLYLSTVLLVLFILAPILYCLLNSLSVAPPTSLDSLYDDYTRQPPMQPPNERDSTATESSVPPIYDVDVAVVNERMRSRQHA